MEKSLTIKQLADQVHVSKSAIRKLMTPEFRSKYCAQSGNRILINSAGVAQISQHFVHRVHSNLENDTHTNANHSNSSSQTNGQNTNTTTFLSGNQITFQEIVATKDNLISELKGQLQQRDHQLDTKDIQINKLQQLLDQEQQLLLKYQQDSSPTTFLPSKTLENETKKIAQPKTSFWSRIFK